MNSSHMSRMVLLFTISLLLLAVTGTQDATTISKSKEDHQIQTLDEQSNTPKNQPSHHQSTNKEGHENTGIRHDVSSQTATTSTFSYVGSSQTYTVPSAGCSSLQITACGAAGKTYLSILSIPYCIYEYIS